MIDRVVLEAGTFARDVGLLILNDEGVAGPACDLSDVPVTIYKKSDGENPIYKMNFYDMEREINPENKNYSSVEKLFMDHAVPGIGSH